MDINDLRAGVTVLSLLLFVGIMVWTWASKRREGFDEAALLPFNDKESAEQAGERP
ncbi:MAG: CcoQ/FixQ family Cbb3-type cytochrome c oxidase assembly chaperone [Rubrivivax sp.]